MDDKEPFTVLSVCFYYRLEYGAAKYRGVYWKYSYYDSRGKLKESTVPAKDELEAFAKANKRLQRFAQFTQMARSRRAK
jgi:hypothetical protein